MQNDQPGQPTQHTLEERAFIEKNGLHLEKTCHIPRIAGRIVGLLMLTSRPVTIAEIGQALQVSHGSISTNLRLLVMLCLLEKVTLSGQRCDHYQFSTSAWDELLNRRMASDQAFYKLASDALKDLQSEGVVQTRFEEMAAWNDLASQKDNEMMAEWRALKAGKPQL